MNTNDTHTNSLFVNMDDMDIIVYNILTNGKDAVWGENIKVWEVETIVAICKDIHEIDIEVTYTYFNEYSSYVSFSANIDLS